MIKNINILRSRTEQKRQIKRNSTTTATKKARKKRRTSEIITRLGFRKLTTTTQLKTASLPAIGNQRRKNRPRPDPTHPRTKQKYTGWVTKFISQEIRQTKKKDKDNGDEDEEEDTFLWHSRWLFVRFMANISVIKIKTGLIGAHSDRQPGPLKKEKKKNHGKFPSK